MCFFLIISIKVRLTFILPRYFMEWNEGKWKKMRLKFFPSKPGARDHKYREVKKHTDRGYFLYFSFLFCVWVLVLYVAIPAGELNACNWVAQHYHTQTNAQIGGGYVLATSMLFLSLILWANRTRKLNAYFLESKKPQCYKTFPTLITFSVSHPKYPHPLSIFLFNQKTGEKEGHAL